MVTADAVLLINVSVIEAPGVNVAPVSNVPEADP